MSSVKGNNVVEKDIKTLPIVTSFLIAGFIGMFSETALNMALNDLITIFQIEPTTVQWLTTGFLLTLGILVPISGLLLQWFETRQLFIASLSFSIAGTLIAALAPNFEFLLVARIVQAVGTALLLPLMFNTILLIFPPEKRGGAMGMIGLVIMFAPAIGPTISGLIIENLSWHWIFWVSLPFLVFALLFGIRFMQNVSTVTKPKIDLLSVLLSTLGFGGVVFGFSSAGEGAEGSSGWENPVVIVSLIVGVVSLLLFSIRQLKMEQPIINLRAFKYPMFVLGLILVFMSMMIILSTMLLLPMYLQGGLGLSSFTAGLLLLPGGLINGFMSPVMGRLFDNYGPKWLVVPGLALCTVILWLFTGINTASTVAFIIVLHSCLMIGVSMIMMPAQTNGLNQLPPQLYPDGTAIMNTLQQVAGAIGTAVGVSILASGQHRFLSSVANPTDPANVSQALTSGVQNAFTFAVIIAVIGFVCSFFIKRVRIQH